MSMLTLFSDDSTLIGTDQLVYPAEDTELLHSLGNTVSVLKNKLASVEREIKQQKKVSSEKGFKDGLKRGRHFARLKLSRVLLAMENERVKLNKKQHEQSIRLAVEIVRKLGLGEPPEKTLVELAVKSAEELRIGEKASLCVHPDQVEVVSSRLQRVPNIDWLLRVEPDDLLELNDCVLRTDCGVLRIGLESQLRVIERSLYE